MRFRSLDAWRGIAALLVALFHFSGRTGHLIPGLGPFVPHSYLFVDFFFVLSGFIVSYAYLKRLETVEGEPFRFLVRRLGRVWPLHVVILAFLLGKMGSGLGPWLSLWTPDGLNPILTNFFLIQGLGLHDELLLNVPSWSISTEFWTYVVFMLLAWRLPRLMPLLAAVLAVLGALVVFRYAPYAMDTTYDFGFFRCIYGFFVGYFVYLALRRWHDQVPAGTLAEVAVVVVAVVFIVVCGARGDRWAILAPVVFAGVVAIFAIERGLISRILQAAPLQHLGAISYSIYMVHVPVLQIFVPLVPFQLSALTHSEWRMFWLAHTPGGGSTLRLYVLLGMYLVIVLALANVTYYLIEQPARRVFNGWSRQRQVAKLEPAPVEGVGE